MTPAQAAKETIKAAIEQSHGPLPPPFVVHFLLDLWRRYLAMTYRDEGKTSDPWIEAVRATEVLVWSVAPKPTKEEKRKLTEQLDSLIINLRIGMTVAGAEDDVQEDFLAELSDWHLGLMSDMTVVGGKPVDLSDTVQLDYNDPRYRELMDILDVASLEKIDIDR